MLVSSFFLERQKGPSVIKKEGHRSNTSSHSEFFPMSPTHGQGGEEGQKQVPSPAPEKWVPITQNLWSFLLYKKAVTPS